MFQVIDYSRYIDMINRYQYKNISHTSHQKQQNLNHNKKIQYPSDQGETIVSVRWSSQINYLQEGFDIIIIVQVGSYLMYNSFIFKKYSIQQSSSEQRQHHMDQWNQKYRTKTRPALVQKYSRRINNFIVKIQDNKQELYEYRQESQIKARQLLKEIYRKERFLGDPRIKVKDSRDWNSIFTTTDRLQMQKNRKAFQDKFGSSNIAFRSIASQSSYVSGHSADFRQRQKDKEIHAHNMRFTSKHSSFSDNKKEKPLKKRSHSSHKEEVKEKDYVIRRISTHNSKNEEQILSNAQSLFSFGGEHRPEEQEQSTSNHREYMHRQVSTLAQRSGKSNKVYFKTVIDIQQNSQQPAVKKALHQILVRFGISRIKDLKKQAMVETDNFQSDDF